MGKSDINKYIALLSKPKINKLNLITEVLSELSFEELQSFKRKTPVLFQGLLKVSYLKRNSFADFFTKGRVLWTNTTDIFGALTFIILNNAKDINHYIQLKEQLDLATATQHYNESYSLLNQIEKEVSVSMTCTYYLLKLTRLDKGITVSTQLYNKICKENNILSYISNIAFKSSPIDLPFEPEIEGRYRALQGDEETCDFFTAFAFPFKRTKGERWMRLLLYTSLIDIYEGVLFQLSCLTADELKKDHLKRLICELAGIIKDKRIQRLYTLVNIGASLPSFWNSSEERELIEKYYAQDYTYVLKKSQEYLKKNPLEATIIDIFYKSCIKLDQKPKDLYPEDSLAGRIHYLYQLSLKNDDISEAGRVLLRSTCIAWYQIPSLRQIYQVVSDIERTRKGSIYKNYWRFSLVPEIRDATFFSDVHTAIDYLVTAGYSKVQSSQVEILEQKREDCFNQTYRLLYGFSDSDIPIYCEEIENKEHTPIITGCITSQLFDRLMVSNHFAEAISLYVKCILNNPNVNVFIDKQMIARVMTDTEDARISNQLELAVFYTMIGAEVYKRYLAYKRFLKSIKHRRISEINDINTPELLYFVGKVADRNVLTLHVLEFDKEEDVTNERIELCKRVFKITNEKSYSDEITSLIKEQEVMALAQQVNDSKIHVDVQSLINSGLSNEKLLFDTYSSIDDNLEMYEQKNLEETLDYILKLSENERKTVIIKYELPSVKYKKMLFQQMFLSIRDKFLFDPIYGLDKYLSARIRHGTLITQLRNHFLTHSLVTNKKEGGDYQRINPWTQYNNTTIPESVKEAINERMLQFTIWLDEQLKSIKDERIQIKTERNDGYVNGLFDYSHDLMASMIDELESNGFDSFEAFVHSAIDLLWRWTNQVLESTRKFFQLYEKIVVEEMTKLQSDVVSLMDGSTSLITKFKAAITDCRTEFQSDISVVTSWFKPEQSNVRFFTIQQAVDTSLSVINKINQNALSFNSIIIKDKNKYSGEYFNAIHDIFHDMMNNILGYEAKRPNLRGKGSIIIYNTDGRLYIDVSNPLDKTDIQELKQIVDNQKNIPTLIAGGRARRETNSGCIKIYSTVMYSLGSGNKYENIVDSNCFIAHIEINTKNLEYNEDTFS